MPIRTRASSAPQETEAILQSIQQICGRKDHEPRGGQLDGKWDPIKGAADRDDEGRVFLGEHELGPHRARAIEEELHGVVRRKLLKPRDAVAVGKREGRDLKYGLAGDGQCFARGAENAELGASAQ